MSRHYSATRLWFDELHDFELHRAQAIAREVGRPMFDSWLNDMISKGLIPSPESHINEGEIAE